MSEQAINKDSISIALVGKGGAGVLTAGAILLTAAARCGRYGLLIPAVGPQIRGGESAALLRLGKTPIDCLDDHFDVLLGINWQHAERFRTDIPLTADSVVVTDPSTGDVPEFISAAGVHIHELEMQALSATVTGGRPNMVALGYVARLAGIADSALLQAIEKKLGRKGRDSIKASNDCVRLGGDQAALTSAVEIESVNGTVDERWLISGNHAAGLGALRGGIRFAAAYPITPATEILEWLAPRLHDAGGTLVQAEDELASINMAIGASYGGCRRRNSARRHQCHAWWSIDRHSDQTRTIRFQCRCLWLARRRATHRCSSEFSCRLRLHNTMGCAPCRSNASSGDRLVGSVHRAG